MGVGRQDKDNAVAFAMVVFGTHNTIEAVGAARAALGVPAGRPGREADLAEGLVARGEERVDLDA